MSQFYALASAGSNSATLPCDCLAHVYGNAADRPHRVRRYPSDLTDAEWAVVRDLLPVPGWLEGRGGQPEGYCHRQMIDQCHEVKSPAAVSSVGGMRGASAIQGIDQDLPEKAEAQWLSLSRAEPMTCSRLVPSSQVSVVVGFVRVELGGLASAWSAAGADRRYAADQGDQGLAVVGVRSRDPDGDGQTGAFSDQVDLRPFLAPVDRIRACQVPPFRARMFTESIAHRLQSSSPRAPSSSSTRRCSFAHTRALVHSVNRRCAVAPDGPNDGEGNCCHVHPDVATNTIAASTSRSPCRRRPPPCGLVGAGGTTR